VSRLYLRLWGGGVLLVLLSLVAQGILLVTTTSDDEDAYYDQIVVAYLTTAEDVARHPTPDARAVELTEAYGYPVVRIPFDDVPADLQPWLQGEAMAHDVVDGLDRIWAMEPGGRTVVRYGPLPPYPMGFDARFYGLSLVVIVLMALLLRVALAPLDRMQRDVEQVARRLADGDLDARIPEAASPELGRVVNQLADQLTGRLQAERELLRTVSHELRTPLARLRLGLGMVARVRDDDRRQHHLDALQGDLEAIDGLVGELLHFARADALTVSQREPISQALTAWAAEAGDVEVDVPPDLLGPPVETSQLRRAVDNLLGNALRHGRRVRLVARDADGLRIRVDDDGPGIPAADRARVLEPFVRLEPGTSGYGVGLSIVARIVHRTGGTLTLDDAELGGLAVTMAWPA
jgi:two-component system sensor histidine kinase RstB